jgi:hypothetical protein
VRQALLNIPPVLVNVPTGNGAKVGSNGLGMEEQQVEAQHSLYLDSFELDD